MHIERFGHAGIRVGDLAAAEAFYRDTLGFEVTARFPADGESLLAVGSRDHLLLQAADASGQPGHLHHVAFEAAEGPRGVAAMARRLAALGIAFQREDHDGAPSVYFQAPDGHLIEVCAAPGSVGRFATAAERLAAARRFVHGNARLLDRALLAHRCDGAPAQHVVAALTAYRNADGGFGHALEPDLRCPTSQPLHTLTALELLQEAGVRHRDIANGCCEFLGALANGDAAVPACLPGAVDYPAADHWHGDFAVQPDLGWTLGVAAALVWHGADHPWAARAVAAGREYLPEMPTTETHLLVYAIRFAGTVLAGDEREDTLRRLCAALPDSGLYVEETPVAGYGLTPLHVAPAPHSPARTCLDDTLVERHLDDLLDSQLGDGGWVIRFRPPSPAAELEWRGRWTVEALNTLHAYGRLR